MATARAALTTTFVMTILCAACAGTVPAGASCMTSGECQAGLACLYALGSGCAASGQCAIPVNDCSGSSAGLIVCGCGGAALDVSCIPSSADLSQRTATGAACAGDGGSEGGPIDGAVDGAPSDGSAGGGLDGGG